MAVALRKGFLGFAAFVFFTAALWPIHAADTESRSFESAEKLHRDGFHEEAEKKLADFVAKHSASPRVPQALLLQAQSALAQKKFQSAINLLATNMANAAAIADKFQFEIARAHAESGQSSAAADHFALLVAKYTNSSLRLRATLGEAQARFQLKQWARVTGLLENPAGVFQQESSRALSGEAIVEGKLLLAEALLQQRNFTGADQVASAVPDNALTAEGKWRREYLRTKAQFSAQKLDLALGTSSNLVSIAATTRQMTLISAGVALQAEILEALDQPEAAIAVYQQNQQAGVPPERIREALFKTVELILAQGQVTNALNRLQSFIAEHPHEAGSDVALLTLAELRLKQHQLLLAGTNLSLTNFAGPSANLVTDALAECDKLLRDFTNSPFAGKAQLVRGWALLTLGKWTDSLTAFRVAADTLPWSESQAVARFKVGDLEFQTREITNALRNYRRVIAEYNSLRHVQSELVPRARYQMLQASLAARDLGPANEAMEGILEEYPRNSFTERSLLLFGQAVDELEIPITARGVFSNFVSRFPDSRLRPDVELAIARTFERERNWSDAIAKYDAWVTAYPTNENLPKAEYCRAVANFQAGRDTNALMLFTNFVLRFPTNHLAARAQDSVGDFYYGARPEQFALAEANYQRVYQNTNWTVMELRELRNRAKLKAGRSAFMRGNHKDAIVYFQEMINDEAGCPEPLRAQASFAYGDAKTEELSTNALEKFRSALNIFDQIEKYHRTDPLVPPAWGRMADCYFQLGSENPENYAKALSYYQKVTNSPSVDLSVRSQAAVGIGHVLQRQAEIAQKAGSGPEASALLDAALSTYLNVVYGNYDGEQPDPVWIKEAALKAAAIDESRNNWNRVLKLYLRVTEMIPSVRDGLQRKIATAQEKAALQKQ